MAEKCYNAESMVKVDKYGRGSAAANGEGFVDLVLVDTFAALEAQLKRRIICVFTPFRLAGSGYLAALTPKGVDPDKKIYSIDV